MQDFSPIETETRYIEKKSNEPNRYVMNQGSWFVGNIVWTSAEDILFRLIQIISYGLGTGFSESIRGSRNLVWWIVLIIIIIVFIRLVGWIAFGVDKYAVPRDIETGETGRENEWMSYLYTTLDFYENISLWFLGGIVTDWVVNIENNGRFIPSQYGLPVLVIPIFLTMVKRLFKDRKSTTNLYRP